MGILKALFSVLLNVGKYLRSHKPLMNKADYLVRQLAEQTDSREDDKLVAAATAQGVSIPDAFLGLPVAKRWHVVLDIATEVLVKAYPSIPTRVIHLAIVWAYMNYRGDLKEAGYE